MPDAKVQRYEFEIVPEGWDEFHEDRVFPFEPFIMEVPTLSSVDFAARRAWWTAFHLLGPKGIEPEEFEVYQWDGNYRGRRVYIGGFVDEPNPNKV